MMAEGLAHALRQAPTADTLARLCLGWPPTGNHYKAPMILRGKIHWYVTKEGTAYAKHVADQVLVQRAKRHLEGPLAIVVDAHPPDKRKRDLDNLWKVLLDSLVRAGICEDDYQFWHKAITRRAPRYGGQVIVTIKRFAA